MKVHIPHWGTEEIKTSGDVGKVIVDDNISPSDIHKQVQVVMFLFLFLVKFHFEINVSFWSKGGQAGDLQIYTKTTVNMN